jgi:hypothetical protein
MHNYKPIAWWLEKEDKLALSYESNKIAAFKVFYKII